MKKITILICLCLMYISGIAVGIFGENNLQIISDKINNKYGERVDKEFATAVLVVFSPLIIILGIAISSIIDIEKFKPKFMFFSIVFIGIWGFALLYEFAPKNTFGKCSIISFTVWWIITFIFVILKIIDNTYKNIEKKIDSEASN